MHEYPYTGRRRRASRIAVPDAIREARDLPLSRRTSTTIAAQEEGRDRAGIQKGEHS